MILALSAAWVSAIPKQEGHEIVIQAHPNSFIYELNWFELGNLKLLNFFLLQSSFKLLSTSHNRDNMGCCEYFHCISVRTTVMLFHYKVYLQVTITAFVCNECK